MVLVGIPSAKLLVQGSLFVHKKDHSLLLIIEL